jgi:hypothetical protein
MSVQPVDASSACGPDKSPGAIDISYTFEGQHLQDPISGNISGTDLRLLLMAEQTVGWKLSPETPVAGDEIQEGTGFISELSSTYAFDSIGVFSGSLMPYGVPTINVINPTPVPPPPSPGTLRFYIDYTPGISDLSCSIFGASNFDLTFSAYSMNDFVNPIYTLIQTGAAGYSLNISTPGYVPFNTVGIYYYDMTISNLATIEIITWGTLQNIFDFDFSQLTSATNFISFPGLSLYDQLLNENTVNELLALFVSLGNLNNYLLINGQIPPAPPTGQGIIDKAELISRGWTVNTD